MFLTNASPNSLSKAAGLAPDPSKHSLLPVPI